MRKKEKNRKKFLGIAAIAIGAILLASIGIVWIGGASPGPDIPHLLNYQGVLTDSAGDLVPDGTYPMTFGIYDSGGNLLWSETQNVQVSDGLYNVLPGSVNPIPADVFCGGADRWIGLKVGSDAEMTPRQRIVSVAYAYAAECAQGIAPGHGLVIKDDNGNVTHRLNASGTSWHAGLETFNGGIEITGHHSPRGWRVEHGADETPPAGVGTGPLGSWTVKHGADEHGAWKTYYNSDGKLSHEEGKSGIMGVAYKKFYNENEELVREESVDQATGTNMVSDGEGNEIREEKINGDSSQTGTHTVHKDGDGYTQIGPYGILTSDKDQGTTSCLDSGTGDWWTKGTKNAIVETANYGTRATYCEEAAEVYFFDRSESRLVNGEVTVELDPIFLETVTINATNPMLVQLTLTGDCNGVYVAQRTASNFTVRELSGGNTNAGFMWEVAAKRKGYEDTRLEEWSE